LLLILHSKNVCDCCCRLQISRALVLSFPTSKFSSPRIEHSIRCWTPRVVDGLGKRVAVECAPAPAGTSIPPRDSEGCAVAAAHPSSHFDRDVGDYLAAVFRLSMIMKIVFI